MEPKANRNAGGARDEPLFAATRWSVVKRAREDSTMALNQLFTQYREPLLIYPIARGQSRDSAEDLVQGFCAHLLSRDFLARVAPDKGRFRTFLLNCLQNYVRDQIDKANTLKRGEGKAPDSLDETDADGKPLRTPASNAASADLEFDKAWARTILANGLHRLAEECGRTGYAALFRPVRHCGRELAGR